MDIQENIVNKVAQSGLLTVDLANYAPKEDITIYDVKDNLFHGLILKEKDFRDFVKDHDWSNYQDKIVAITCSTDAIVPTWTYMILANKLTPYAKSVHFGTVEEVQQRLFLEEVAKIDYSQYQDQRVVVKGCGDIYVPESAFVLFTAQLSAVAKSIMYGEACSTVPVFKRKS
ncbi:DUF2480 family protein [Sphingobacterium alkalisoli]|uniref:DUF2480 family protein n=1 Tax=Sphingobacterium alkalisoli TaxID=1874115 RepID=A0A4U0GYU8_9SPHI|nr:DUF2480 family protein [Sphingobacterium alkalisoli]TJY64400.1 DUF2480 family protein [Sphingobacterium alkalisoli]GGH21993.1 hypothetical protein GCM10011418_28230 [Sphingobacterium alkalisoli]